MKEGTGKMTAAIEVKNLTKTFENMEKKAFKVLDNISLEVKKEEFVSVLGPSGCGKSTLLNTVSGLETFDSGSIMVSGKPVSSANGNARIGYVFQNPRLLNWMTIEKNITYALSGTDIPKEQWKGIAQDAIKTVGLKGVENSYPLQLSGGMQQRVSIARALAIKPDIILMDEPFSHLDEITAEKLRKELLDVWQKTKVSILFVTHDMSEAVFLSDKIYMMSAKPTTIFMEYRVKMKRPRNKLDGSLLKIERQLMGKFQKKCALGADGIAI